MTNICQPLWIDIVACEQQIGSSPHIHNLLNHVCHLLLVERRLVVVVKTMNDVSVLGCCNRADQEAHDEKPDNHECRSGSAIKYRLKILSYFIRFMAYSQR